MTGAELTELHPHQWVVSLWPLWVLIFGLIAGWIARLIR